MTFRPFSHMGERTVGSDSGQFHLGERTNTSNSWQVLYMGYEYAYGNSGDIFLF